MNIAKRVLLLLLLSISIISCKDDEVINNVNVTNDALIGTWIGTSVNYTSTTTTSILGVNTVADAVGKGFDYDFRITISENPNLLISSGSYSIELTTTALGQSSKQNVEGLVFENTGSWTLDGNEITISDNVKKTVIKVTELTDNSLKMNILVEEDLSNFGAEVKTKVDSNFEFRR